MKVEEDKIKISAGLNESVWAHGIQKPQQGPGEGHQVRRGRHCGIVE